MKNIYFLSICETGGKENAGWQRELFYFLVSIPIKLLMNHSAQTQLHILWGQTLLQDLGCT